MNKYHLFSILLLMVLPAIVWPQQKDFAFKNFTQEEGLPSNESYCVFEDSKHYLWIGTDNGVVRFNGNRFEVFDLPDKTVFQIREDSKGRIWFFTFHAQFAYFENGKIYPYEHNAILKQRILKLHIKDVYIDVNDNIYLSSSLDSNYIINKQGNITSINHYKKNIEKAHIQIDVLDNKTCFTKFIRRTDAFDKVNITVVKNGYKTDYHLPEKIQNSSQYGSICTEAKSIYFFYGDVIAKLLNDGTYIVKRMPGTILSIKHKDGLLYVGVAGEGLFVFDKDITQAEPQRYFRGKSISSVLFDYEDGMWATTIGKGVLYVKNKLLKHILLEKEEDQNISYAMPFNDSTLLFTTPEGIFALTKSKKELLLKQKNEKITSIIANGKNGYFVFGSFLGFFSKIIYNLPYNIRFFSLHTNPTLFTQLYGDYMIAPTTLWVVKGKTALIAKPDADKGPNDTTLPIEKILLNNPAKIFMDQRGILWGGTQDGLYKSVPPYDTLLPENKSPLLNKGIDFIASMGNGLLAISTQPGNIVLYDKEILGSISEKEGLLGNKIRYLLPLKNQLWVATQLGISVIEFSSYKPLHYTITNIDKKDGLFNCTINQLLQYNGSIIAATTNGLYYIDEPGLILQQKKAVIPFVISNISYYKGDISNVSSITLPYSKNRAIIKYRAVCYNSFENIQYRYRFISGDTIWHSTTSNELVLENLEHGKYTLQVKAVIPAQLRSSEIQVLMITVEKPWWQNNWFRLFSLLTVGSIIYWLVKRRINKIQAEEKRKTDLNAKLAELEQTALRSQMNPHFIFNCLTSIQQLIISGNKVEANEYLVKFAKLIRKTLELSAHPFISISEEKKYLEEYLGLEQLRLSGHFDFIVSYDDTINAGSTLIPNMMIQPVVENCIRHGIKSLETRKGIITVHFKQMKNFIGCTITDNGVGRIGVSKGGVSFTEHKSYGIDIVRKRLETFAETNTDESGIEIIDLFDDNGQPAGTRVILNLPYKKSV